MQSIIPPGDPAYTVIAGKDQGYLGLAINFSMVEDTGFPGQFFPAMITAWEPTDAERAAIAAGANIIVQILGNPPIRPMCLYVGEVPQDKPCRYCRTPEGEAIMTGLPGNSCENCMNTGIEH